VEKGTLVEFWHNGERRLGICDRPEGKKLWVVIDARQQSHNLHPTKDITYTIAGVSCKQPADIDRFLADVTPNLDPASLSVAWEMLVDDGEQVDPPAMAELLYADTSPALCYAAYCLLSADKVYFKNKKDWNYEPRSRAQVAEIQHQLAVKEQKEQELRGFLDRVAAKTGMIENIDNLDIAWTDADRLRLETLEKYVLQPDNPPKGLTELLALLHLSQTNQQVFDFLVSVGWWMPHENLFLRRSQVSENFPPKVIEAVDRMLTNFPADLDVNRLDLTHLKVYTIDDESTQEIDDGLSLETMPDGRFKIWVHIADPTRFVAPGDDIDLEARKRSTTIYMPTGMIPMFPTALATGPMSLVQGRVCCALSFGVILDDRGAVSEYQITAATIKPTYRLTYEDVDEMLQLGIQNEPEVEAFFRLAKLRQQWRQSQGSINISMPEAAIKVNGDEVSISIVEDSPSRQLVAEMMIMTGEVAAKYGQEHNLPLPYRGQPQPELPPDEELMQLPPGPVRFCAIRRCMPRSEMWVHPVRHASLGLDTYCQATSPIRRYTDMLVHFQIKSHLRGEALPFDAEQLQDMVQVISATSYEATLMERQTSRYWALEYLDRNRHQPWDALMLRWLREDDSLGLILLEELGLELAMRFNRWIDPGDRIQVQVTFVDPRQDVIHLREVIQQESSAIS
jgi:exoribonuclease-2